jgi:DNA modification methylase
MIETEHAKVFHGSNLDVLPTLADNSIDAIVTDPPYELGFMGKSWDSSGIAYSVELWSECMRVLKPGGHLLAFGGSRTWHRLAVAIEDAGFEMRDSIAWLYGSGFPKSMDVSKAIDKVNGEGKRLEKFISFMKTTKLKPKEIDEALKNAGLISNTSNRAIHYFNEGQPQIPTLAMWQVIRPLIAEVPEWVDEMVARIEAEREVIGKKEWSNSANHFVPGNDHTSRVNLDITAPATPEAIKWQGWGTALKPAFEPVVVARKPFKGTVAGNVLEWGVGGLNIDGSRIGRAEGDNSSAGNRTATFGTQDTQSGGDGSGGWEQNSGGRWPANIILDPYTAELLDEQSGESTSRIGKPRGTTKTGLFANSEFNKVGTEHNDSGGASRFFYVAKASKRDRNEGLEELDAVRHSDREMADGVGGDNPRNRTNEAKQNFHPTVKPTSLMRYLIKLVTPPNGTVLDPFTGSGSTGKAAILEGFNFVGIELTEDYLPIIKGRLEHAEATLNADATEQEQEQKETLF